VARAYSDHPLRTDLLTVPVTDFGQDPDGRWWVEADTDDATLTADLARAQTPVANRKTAEQKARAALTANRARRDALASSILGATKPSTAAAQASQAWSAAQQNAQIVDALLVQVSNLVRLFLDDLNDVD
jgi:hypothetical protein